MRKISILLTVTMLVACNSSKKPRSNLDSVASPGGTEVFQPNWENMAQNYKFPEWFSDGKFGIFIHWGVYAVPAFTNEWYPRNMYRKHSDDSAVYKYHVEKYGPQDKFGYKDFIPMFKAEKFNAEQWAQLFKSAGAKYVVPVAECNGLKLLFPKDKPDQCAYSFRLSFDKPVGAHIPSEMIGVPLKHADNTLPGLRKLMDIYLRDPSICRGPDSTWYLTGTINPPEGIKVWKSNDLVKWEPLGIVWKPGASAWHKPYLKQGIPLWAPEIHYINGTFWITYSMPGWNASDPKSFDPKNSGCGLLKSSSGKPEGPYVDVQPDRRLGDEIDASLFQDDDGSVYFLWHSGKIAKMKPEMSGLAEPYHWLKLTVADPDPSHHSRLCPLVFGKDSFDHIGYEGMFMFKTNGLYYLCGSDYGEGGRYSCYIATSRNIYGPYSERYEALPYCGHNVFFQDGKKQWWSTFFGSDPGAPWQEQPGILPVTISAEGNVSAN